LAQWAPAPAGGRRRRPGRFSTGRLVAIAVVIAVACMIGLTAKAAVGKASCSNAPVLVNVVASNDIAPAVQSVAKAFNNQNVTTAGRCVEVQVDQADSATQADQIDGQSKAQGPAIDAWIPDSTLWVDVARSYPVGAQTVQPTGKNVARSPLMIVTTKAVAAQTGIFAVPPDWNVLLPSAYGGPPASLNLTVDLPDPVSSASGLASLVQVSRVLGTGAAARNAVTDFALHVQTTQSFDSASLLSQFVQTTLPPFDHNSMTVATEQAVLAYDKTNPKVQLAAQYATGATQSLGTPQLDYPYVLTTSQPTTLQGAEAFGNYLQTNYAQSVMRYYGFRSADGVPGVMPKSAGLAAQPLQLAASVSPTEAAANLQAWERLGLGFRDLILTDVSPAMNQPSGLGTLTVQQLVSQTAQQGLGLFPDSTQMGLWEMGKSSSASSPYQELVPIGALSADYGMILRRQQILDIDATTTTSPNGIMALHTVILAAYQMMTRTYAPNYSNAIVVLTSGVDSAPGDISLNSLLSQLQQLYNPSKKIDIVILMFGNRGDFSALQKIADATGGAAFQVTNPAEIGQVFVQAVSQRMCNPNCGAP
jgi:Ca-activated chloride channel family protein